MTATQMYQAFLNKINQSGSFNLFTWDVAYWLNVAQEELFNVTFYPDETKRSINDLPRNGYEDSAFSGEVLHPFNMVGIFTTSAKGFITKPAALAHLIALSVVNNDKDCAGGMNFIPCQYLRHDELYEAIVDPFERPTWSTEKNRNILVKAPRYINEQSIDDTDIVIGYRVLPERTWNIQMRYVIYPPAIVIENTALDDEYTTVPQYQNNPADIDSLFPEFVHNELVIRAVNNFMRSLPDYQQNQVESQKVMTGQM